MLALTLIALLLLTLLVPLIALISPSRLHGFFHAARWIGGLVAIWLLEVNDICQAVPKERSLTEAS